MKLFYIKQGRNKRPINGGALLSSKPSIGNYCPVVVGDDVKVVVNAYGAFPSAPYTENQTIDADMVNLYAYSDYHPGTEYSYLDTIACMMPYDSPKTIGQLLENFNKKCAHMGHLSLENGLIYLTKSSMAAKFTSAGMWGGYLSSWV